MPSRVKTKFLGKRIAGQVERIVRVEATKNLVKLQLLLKNGKVVEAYLVTEEGAKRID